MSKSAEAIWVRVICVTQDFMIGWNCLLLLNSRRNNAKKIKRKSRNFGTGNDLADPKSRFFLTHLTDIYRELASIRRDLDQIKTILLRHEQILNELPEALRQKIGFTEGVRGQ